MIFQEFQSHIFRISFSSKKRNPEGDWRRVNYAFTYNKTNVFKSSLDVSGYNEQSSLVDVFSDYAQGVSIDNLNQFYEGGAFWVDLIDLEIRYCWRVDR